MSGCQGRGVSWGHCCLSREVGDRCPADQRDGPRGAEMWEGLGGDGGQNRGLWVITGAAARAHGSWEDSYDILHPHSMPQGQEWKGSLRLSCLKGYYVSEKGLGTEHVQGSCPELGEVG